MRVMQRLLAAAFVCGLVTGARLEAAPSGAPSHHHEHASEGPHHGALIELGKEDYHAELVHDEASDTVIVYILDGSAAKAVPTTAKQITINLRVAGKPQQFSLMAKPQPGDPEGSSSVFAAADKQLSQALDAAGAFGRLNAEIAGKVYVGKVAGHTHTHLH